MTNEEKQALIENIKSVIDEYDQFGGGGIDEQVYRIALASMMANPVAYTDIEQLTELSKSTFAEMYSPDDSFKSDPEWVPLFTRPAPAINLAELVPDELLARLEKEANTISDWYHIDEHSCKVNRRDLITITEACRAAILRNIEEAK
ncbi:hypothetical protein [Pantoea anthophila]|uniref:hypothetical protein n=1 Tax=Pantoea anthophila TaxID=470931 RepID=UPI003CFA58A9